MGDSLGILTLNLASPSVARANGLLDWLATRDEEIFVLTETSSAQGSRVIAERFFAAGWEVRFPLPSDGERGVVIASRVGLDAPSTNFTPVFGARAEHARLAGGSLQVIALYVPSRDDSPEKTDRKQQFVDGAARAFSGRFVPSAVLAGDLNVVEPAHRPPRREFHDWEFGFYEQLRATGWEDAYRRLHPDSVEHSWVGPHEDGYRFDHIFVREELGARIDACAYDHEPRERGLSDHSAMAIELRGIETELLDVDRSLAGDQSALF